MRGLLRLLLGTASAIETRCWIISLNDFSGGPLKRSFVHDVRLKLSERVVKRIGNLVFILHQILVQSDRSHV